MQTKQAPQTDDQRTVLEMNRDHPGATPKDILGMLDRPYLTVEYVQQVIHNFTLDQDMTEQKQTEKSDEPNTDIPDAITGKARQIIEAINEDPELNVLQIADAADATTPYTRNMLKAHSHYTPADAVIWEGITRPDDITDLEHINADLRREIIVTVRGQVEDGTITGHDDPSAADIGAMIGTDSSYVLSTTRTYQHLLPDVWTSKLDDLAPLDGEGVSPMVECEQDDLEEEEETLESLFDEAVEEEEQTGLDSLFDSDGYMDIDDGEDDEDTDELESKNEKLEETVNSLRDELTEVNAKLETTERQADHKEELLEQRNGTINNLHEQIDELEDGNMTLQNRLDELKEDAKKTGTDERDIDTLQKAAETHAQSGSPTRQSFGDGVRYALTVLGHENSS